jgi:hypothetical protein
MPGCQTPIGPLGGLSSLDTALDAGHYSQIANHTVAQCH